MEVSSIIKKYPKRREFVLEILHDIQNHDPQHYLTNSSIKKVAQHLSLPLAQIYGIIGYYTMLSTKPRGKFLIKVCNSPVCGMMGSESILSTLDSILNADVSNQGDNNIFYVEETECLGLCNESPCMMVNSKIYGNLTPEKVKSIILELKSST